MIGMNKYEKLSKKANKLWNDKGMNLWKFALFHGILDELDKSHHLNITNEVYDFVEREIHFLNNAGLPAYGKAHVEIVMRTLNKFQNK